MVSANVDARHRTPSERRASASAAEAVRRARAHTAPTFDPDAVEPDAPNTGGRVTPAVARAIREQLEIERNRA